MIKKTPFQTYKYEEDRKPLDIFSIRLNKIERYELDKAKLIIQQPKDSTAIKLLANIGIYEVLHDQKIRFLIDQIFINQRCNERTGIPIEPLKDQGLKQM